MGCGGASLSLVLRVYFCEERIGMVFWSEVRPGCFNDYPGWMDLAMGFLVFGRNLV